MLLRPRRVLQDETATGQELVWSEALQWTRSSNFKQHIIYLRCQRR